MGSTDTPTGPERSGPEQAGSTSRRRDVRLDRIRGAAIVLMVIDHIAAWLIAHLDNPAVLDVAQWIRTWPTRLAMPAFMVVSGMLLASHEPSTRRRAQVAIAAVVVNAAIIATQPGIYAPEILAVWSIVIVAAPAIAAWPIPVAAAGILWAYTWPLHWAGYQPGIISAYLALGVLAANTNNNLATIGTHLPQWTEPLGRRPLTLYVAHLLALCFAAALW